MNQAKVSLLKRLGTMCGPRASFALVLVAALVMPLAASAKAGPDGFADLATKLLPAVVNISTTQTIKPDRGNGGNGGGGANRPAPDMPQFPPGSPFEQFFKDFLDRNQRQGQGQQEACRVSRPRSAPASSSIPRASS